MCGVVDLRCMLYWRVRSERETHSCPGNQVGGAGASRRERVKESEKESGKRKTKR